MPVTVETLPKTPARSFVPGLGISHQTSTVRRAMSTALFTTVIRPAAEAVPSRASKEHGLAGS